MIKKIRNSLHWRLTFLSSLAMPLVNAVKMAATSRRIRHLLQAKTPLCVEVGGGDRKGKNGWLNIDISKKCDLYWDLRHGLPFPDNSLARIYSSHFMEHLTFEEGQVFLAECKRALAPGGSFSITVPNARLYIDLYVKGGDWDASRVFKYAFNKTTPIDYVNYIAYMAGHHKYMFDQENLLHLLRTKGFRNVRTRPFDASIDSESRDYESIYAEAEK